MSKPLNVLIIEDSEDDASLEIRELARAGYDLDALRVDTPEAMSLALDGKAWDLILADFTMPRFSAPDALRLTQERDIDIPFIIVSGSVGEHVAVAAMKAGANDYIMKGNLARLVPAVDRELREAAGRRERRRLEQQLVQAQKMEVVGRLAGGVAHDFNNLLTVILGYAEIVEELLPKDSPAHEGLRVIGQTAERAADLTRQLLAFSRQQVVEPKLFDLNELVANLDLMLRRLIGEDIELVSVTKSENGIVKADRGQIEQVVVNLVVNARDAMLHGGRLTIETDNVVLDDTYSRMHTGVAPGDYVMLAVSDTGIGMDETIIPHIFEPFFTTKEPGKGTGLGLATCYGIVRQSSGSIWVYSEVGHGTTIKVYLPRALEQGQAVAPAVVDAPAMGVETILVVEDEPLVREITIIALKNQGYVVLSATNGVEALRVAGEHEGPIHLMLTDVVMPEMGGKQLADAMRKLRPETKILFTSGYTDTAIVYHDLGARGVGFLQKPFTPGVLTRRVREVLGPHSNPTSRD